MEESLKITLLLTETIIVGISAQVIADYLHLPSIVFLLLFGILLGSDGFGFLDPSILGSGLEVIVSLSMSLILFEGGLNIQLGELRDVSRSLRNLVTIGVLITLISGAMAAHWLSAFPWSMAFLYASLVVVTGPTVVNPLLKQVGADREITTLLEGEGVLVDPIGAILAVIALNIVLSGDVHPLILMKALLLRLGIGGVIGVGGGWLLSLFLKHALFLAQELKNLVVLAGVWSLFSLAQGLRSESGLMVAVLAGIVIRAASLPQERSLRQFDQQLSILANSVLFILLAADLSIPSIFALNWQSVLTVGVLMLVVRPVNVLVSTWNSDLNWQQKAFLSWIAPRGIVAASVASLFAMSLSRQGINGGDSVKALVFLTIILTVFLQGFSARPIASLLHLRSSEAGAVIVGCHPLGRLLARLLQQRGESVVLIDTNPDDCAQARQENLQAFVSNGLDLDVLETAGLSSVGTFLAISSNSEVNSVLAQLVLCKFHPHTVAILSQNSPALKDSQQTGGERICQAFAPQVSVEVWTQYISDDQVKLGEIILQNDDFEFQQAQLQVLISAGNLVPLLVEREESLRVALAGEDWLIGDRLTCLLHIPKPQVLTSSSNSQVPLILGNLSAVE